MQPSEVDTAIKSTHDNSQISEGHPRKGNMSKKLMDKQQKQNFIKVKEYKNASKFNLKHVPSTRSNLKDTDIFNESTSQRIDKSIKLKNKPRIISHQRKKIIR